MKIIFQEVANVELQVQNKICNSVNLKIDVAQLICQ